MKPCETHAQLVASLWRIGFLTLAVLIALGMWLG